MSATNLGGDSHDVSVGSFMNGFTREENASDVVQMRHVGANLTTLYRLFYATNLIFKT